MRLQLWLLVSFFLACSTPAFAETSSPGAAIEHLAEGLTAMRQGDKEKAWELLFPYAKAGDVQAMFYLGDMMLRSPEYGDNLERAMKFFTVAANKGHQGAIKLLPQVQQLIAQKAAGGLPTIAGASGMPLQRDIDRVTQELEKYKREVLRYTDAPIMSAGVEKLEVLIFVDQSGPTLDRFSQILKSLQSQFGDRIRTRFYVSIDPSNWTPESTPIGASSIPPGGVMPDFRGQIAASHGVTRTPAIVVVPKNGTKTVVTDLNSLPNLISRLL